MLAYRLSTGALLPFAPKTNGVVRALAASSDGSTIYLGGTFTTVNGSGAAPYLAAVSASSGSLVPSFAPRPNSAVYALARGGSTIFVGGLFTRMGSVGRTRAAAVSQAGALLPWSPVVPDGKVSALVVNSTLGRVVLGGNFSGLNGDTATHRGSGMVDAGTGRTDPPWGVGGAVKNWGTDAAILSLTSDGTNIYGTGYVYGVNGNLEGAFSAPWSTGALRWIEDCHGDTYSAAVLDSAVYVAGHPHVCSTIGGFPETNPRTWHRALAFTTAVTGVVGRNTASGYYNWQGKPAPSLLVWFPDFNTGTFTGQGQGPWSVAASGSYVVYGGEFTTVNGVPQQGLVRFALAAVAPNKEGPRVSTGDLTISVTHVTAGTALSWKTVWDRDNTGLTYSLRRNGVPITTRVVSSTFWSRPTVSVVDTAPGTAPKYSVSVADPFGNTRSGPVATG
ncbi:MAG: hypothetical protein ACTHMH_03095 [Curtobacterium sp.]